MSIRDILKKSFVEGYASMDLELTEVVVCMLCTVLIATYIYVIYKSIMRKSFYNRNFNLSLITLAVITAAIILTIQSNIVVSLGMVGALSIVRFRTAIKDPMDLIFLFWSISVGIICGAGFAAIAIIASIVVTIVILIFARIPTCDSEKILLVNANDYDAEDKIMEILEEYAKDYQIKSRNLTKDHLDMAIELKVSDEKEFMKKLMDAPGVTAASLVSHEGEVTL